MEQKIDERLNAFIEERVKKVPVVLRGGFHELCRTLIKEGAKWQKEHLWKPADGEDLPEIDREVIVLLNNGRVTFGHRPPEYFDSKDIITEKVTRNYIERYDKGLWNLPNIKYWLDCDLPKLKED